MASNSKGTILVTGANGGLGTAIVHTILARPELASELHGVYTVRDVAKATSLKAALSSSISSSSSSPKHAHTIQPLDLLSLASVREAAATINAKVSASELPPIKAIVLNAGFREPVGQTWTEDGLDTAFVSNYLAHWLLVLLLIQSVDSEAGRVVVIGGWVHDPFDENNKSSGAYKDEEWKKIFADASSESVDAVARGKWSPSSDDPSKDPIGMSGIRRYGAGKLCTIMMIHELQQRLDSDPRLSRISVLGVDPGMMPTTITTATLNWLIRFIMRVVAQISCHLSPNGMIRLPQKSATDVLAAATDTSPPFGEQPKGLYFNGSEPKETSEEARDEAKRAAVWTASVQYAGLKEGETCLADWK